MAYDAWFDIPLTCQACGAGLSGEEAGLFARRLLDEPYGGRYTVGDQLAVGAEDFAAVYYRLREPEPANPFRVLEGFACGTCGAQGWAELTFVPEGDAAARLVAGQSVPLSEELFERVHYVSERLIDWVTLPDPEASRWLPTAMRFMPEAFGQ